MNKHTNASLHTRDRRHYLPTFKRYPVAIHRGKGSHVWDIEGNKYLDALAGIAVNSVGHAHPRLISAIAEQAGQLMHISNFFPTRPQVELSERLVALSGLDRVFLTNSGAESVEGAIKIARKYAHSKGRGGTVISVEGAFHGRTLATIATGKKQMQQGFEPIPRGFRQIPFNDIEAARSCVSEDTAAFLIEPIQGEGGIRPADAEFLKTLRTLCDRHDLVLIFDEIQCGVGRTGHWFAKDYYEVQPDIMTLAKGLGGGFPVGAILSNEKVSQAIDYGDHGTTFGGNPLACAAALAVLQILEDEDLVLSARTKGKWLMEELRTINPPGIRTVRGMGLMIGVECDFAAAPLVEDMMRNGVLTNATAGNVLRLVPPLTIAQDELEQLTRAITNSIQRVTQHA